MSTLWAKFFLTSTYAAMESAARSGYARSGRRGRQVRERAGRFGAVSFWSSTTSASKSAMSSKSL